MGNDNLTHRDKGLKLTDYYAYGKPIYAIGDGTVVSVLNTQDESEDLLKKPEEDETEYLQRVQLNQQNLLMKGFKYILGNHVIIKHAHGEYSFYVHMKQGSINLKEGDKVKQGDEIGALGNSGNSTEPHLHFHVANSPNFVESRSLPIRFKNIKLFPDDNGKITHLHAGQVVVSK
jgi:murein DD-endopeptidase MepM/ murein hydrolase activator NlpD